MNTHRNDNPVKTVLPSEQLCDLLDQACDLRGLSSRGARLLHHYNNAVFYLPHEQAVARVTSGKPTREPLVYGALCELVNDHGIAATVPLTAAEPVIVDAATSVSFWVYYHQPDHGPELTSTHLAGILRELHRVDRLGVGLDRWRPLASLSAALSSPATRQNLSPEDRDWLPRYVEDVRHQVDALDSPLGHGVIHGDAWAGNLLWRDVDQQILGDWDWISIGPREVDLVPTWHAAIRYGKGTEWSKAFARIYGFDLQAWDGFSTLLRMRDLVQLTGPLRRAQHDPVFADVLRERISGIRQGDMTVRWRAL
jgi:Ser/Thr protein kinase RdoA (MazF antagonist)